MSLALCPTSMIMGALTVSIIIADAWFLYTDRIPTHAILGGIATALFYVLCDRGYEMINWIFLAIIPVYVIVSLSNTKVKQSIHQSSDEYVPSGGCRRCNVPASSCPCVKPPPKPKCNTKPKEATGSSCGQAAVQSRINTEDPTPSTKAWYNRKTNL